MPERAYEFVKWVKSCTEQDDLQSIRYAHLVIEQFTVEEIDALLIGTEFAGKATEIKVWEQKLRDLNAAIELSATLAEGV